VEPDVSAGDWRREVQPHRNAADLGPHLVASINSAGFTRPVPAADLELLRSLGDDLKFVLITSSAQAGESSDGAVAVEVRASSDPKCERCWHYRADVGADPAHPDICGRCVSNMSGSGELREYA